MEIIDTQYFDIDCLIANQPIGSMYVGVMNSDDLIKISFADVRRMELGIENREVEDYIGIQRGLSTSREKEIGKYVNLVDATFPNSIILSISSQYASYNPESRKLSIAFKDHVAKVLDGQHRIAGLQYFSQDGRNFQCIVTIYIDMELEDQAIVFSTINKEQKNVSNSLVTDLFDFATSRSPQKTGHNIARALSKLENSPFYRKIKILGTAYHKETESITQDTFVKSLLRYISPDPQKDRDFYKRNKGKDANLPLIEGKDLNRYFLRNIFIEDKKDIKIAQIIFNYFWAVNKKWPNAWGQLKDNNILNKSTGFIALMNFFKNVYLSFGKIGEVITKEEFYSIFEKIDIEEGDFNKDNYLPGTAGQGKLYRDLMERSGLN
jgi:DGQHR domain-containing protein